MSHIIYMNNAATGYPKFNKTIRAVTSALENGELSSNRDAVDVLGLGAKIFRLRAQISDFIGVVEPHNICLTPSDSIALNIIIQGLVPKNNTSPVVVFTTPYEHNSVSRPLAFLERAVPHVIVEKIPFKDGDVDFSGLEDLILHYKKSKISIAGAVCSHGSNVTGDIIDIISLGTLLHNHKVPFVVDAAQTIGIVPIDVEQSYVDALTFAGHKFLNGPQGTGGFYVRDSFPISPLFFGGTGNGSGEVNPPIIRPDSFEVGTPATHDLLGLSASIDVITDDIGKDIYRETILSCAQYLRERLEEVPNIIIYGAVKKDTPVVSFNIKKTSCFDVGQYLSSFGIVCRTGIHCSAYSMTALGLEEYGGSVRLSLGYYNTKKEIDFVVDKLKSIG